MSYEVIVYEDPNMWHPHRYALKIIRDNKELQIEYDSCEPEDNSFWRHWAWVEQALKDAYQYGVEDGRK